MVFIKSLLAICVLSAATVATGANLMGEFQGASLQFDAEIESPEINTQVGTVPLIGPGQSVEVQLFMPEAAGEKTLGYSLEFDEATLSLFTVTGEDFLGAQLRGEPDKPVLAALLIGQPTVPTDGFVGTLTFTAKSQIEEGLIIRPSFASLAGPSAEGDELDLSRAAILFTADYYVAGVVGDLDRDGDVDFRDFLTFAVNYGKSGPIPTGRTRLVTIIEAGTTSGGDTDTVVVTLVDTLKQTVRDTIFQTRTDTLTNNIIVIDTFYVAQQQDTITIRDSIFVEVKDTVLQVQTVVQRDTVVQVQTVIRTDTVTVTQPIYIDSGDDTRPPLLASWSDVVDAVEETVYWVGVTQRPTSSNPSPDLIFVGTAFAVGVDAIATNAHVAVGVSQLMSNPRSFGLTPIPFIVQASSRSFLAGTFALSTTLDGTDIIGFVHPGYDFTVDSPDIAILGVETSVSLNWAHVLPTKLSKALETGDEIATLGFPGELEQAVERFSSRVPTLKTGNISALRPYNALTTVHRITNRIVQHDFDTTPGTSGSPIFNRRGEVVAINHAGFEQGSLGFGIRADELRELLEAVSIEFGIDLANSKAALGAGPLTLGQRIRLGGYTLHGSKATE